MCLCVYICVVYGCLVEGYAPERRQSQRKTGGVLSPHSLPCPETRSLTEIVARQAGSKPQGSTSFHSILQGSYRHTWVGVRGDLSLDPQFCEASPLD